MRHLFLLLPFCLLGCTRERPAPIENKGGMYFSKNAVTDMRGNELPKYSTSNPPPREEYHAEKYVSDAPNYGVAASLDKVQSGDLAPPPSSIAAPVSSTPSSISTEKAAQSGGQTFPGNPQPLEPMEEIAQEAPVAAPVNSIHAPPPANSASTSPAQRFVQPLRGKQISGFETGTSDSLEIAARAGEPIRAAADGVVTAADNRDRSLGNRVILDHGNGWTTSYAHLGSLIVKKGDRLVQGQLIGFVGKTGNASQPELRFTVRKDGTAVDPQQYID